MYVASNVDIFYGFIALIHSSSRGITSCPFKQLGHICIVKQFETQLHHVKTWADNLKPTFKFLQDIHLRLLWKQHVGTLWKRACNLLSCSTPAPRLSVLVLLRNPQIPKLLILLHHHQTPSFIPDPIQTITITSHTQPTRNTHFPCWIT